MCDNKVRPQIFVPPYKLAYVKVCHLYVVLERSACCANKHLNFELDKVCNERKLNLNLLEVHEDASRGCQSNKDKMERAHDSHIYMKSFQLGQKVLLLIIQPGLTFIFVLYAPVFLLHASRGIFFIFVFQKYPSHLKAPSFFAPCMLCPSSVFSFSGVVVF